METAGLNERVAEILRAACRAIAREGASGLRVESVAREAGVSKALVHYYFRTRRELLRAAFAYADDRWRARAQAELALIASGAERLERYLLLYVGDEEDLLENRALWNEAWSGMPLDGELAPDVKAAYRRWADWLLELVEEGREDGSIPAGIACEDAALRLTALADGLDSLLYLGLIDRGRACELVRQSVAHELDTAAERSR